MAQLVKEPAAKSDDPSLTSRIMVEGENQQLPQADWPLTTTCTMAHVHAHTYMNKYFQSYFIDCNIFICERNLQKSPEVPRMSIFSLRSNIPYLLHLCQSVNWNLKISVKIWTGGTWKYKVHSEEDTFCYKLAISRLSWPWPLTS